MNIFLVEDSLASRGQLAAMLATVPGARIVGVHLAERSGFDVLNAVHVNAPEIDLCMLTSFAAQPYRQLAGRLGARAVFDKGSELERVRELVARRAL